LSYIGSKPANKPVVASDLDPAVITGQTALATSPADTDEFLISDAGVLKRMDYSYIKGTLTSATAVTASDQSEIDFTSIPSGVKHIKLILSEISNSSTAEDLIAQIGDSGGVETSGYTSTMVYNETGAGQGGASRTDGWTLGYRPSASDVMTGVVDFALVDASTYTWCYSAVVKTSTSYVGIGSGSKSLSAELDRVRIKMSGSQTLDAGKVNIMYSK